MTMNVIIFDWFKRYFSDPQVVFLTTFLIIAFAIIMSMGDMLMPVFASIVVAYLLEGVVCKLENHKSPRSIAVLFVYITFITFVLFVFIGIMPLLYNQASELVQKVPNWINQGQKMLSQLPERYPDYLSETQIQDLTNGMTEQFGTFSQHVLEISVNTLVNGITLLVYLILMPILVLFFLKDKKHILNWFVQFIPKERSMAKKVWREMDLQIGNYVRGKFWEVMIVWSATFLTFTLMELNFSMLLAVLVGLSVIIPYVGAVVVTFPVILIAFFQWGMGPDFAYLVAAYFIVQGLDGYVLVPLLFSEVVNLHPVAIIVSILTFGGIWGFWGVFFAIPLATLVQAVLSAWPKATTQPELEAS